MIVSIYYIYFNNLIAIIGLHKFGHLFLFYEAFVDCINNW